MGETQKKLKTMSGHGFTQFELTTDLLKNLYKFDLTPVTKLVLLELTTHLNEEKNGFVVFPSTKYISEVLGIGLTACKKAINDLISAGLIIKTKRNKVKGNFNKYLLTSKIRGVKSSDWINSACDGLKIQNSTSEWAENEFFKQSENELFMITNKKEQINNKDEEKILKNYAIKHDAKNVSAYVNVLRKNGSAAQILQEYRQAKVNSKVMAEYTKSQVKQAQNDRLCSAQPTQKWKELRKVLMS